MKSVRIWLLMISFLILHEYVFADSSASCGMANCSSYKSPDVSAKIAACELTLATHDCESLGSDIQLRDCKTEAYCSNFLDNSYIAGCVFGVKDFAVGIITSPIELARQIRKQLDYDSRYSNSYLYRSCKQAEDKVNSGRLSAQELDCQQTFWRSACPRTILNSCKESLLLEFPDIKASYGSGYSQISYDQVYKDTHKRLNAINSTKPSLAKFLEEHREHPLDDIANIVRESLRKESACLSPKSFSKISCDRILNIVSLLSGGYAAIKKIGKTAAISSELTSPSTLSSKLERMGLKNSHNGNPTVRLPRKGKYPENIQLSQDSIYFEDAVIKPGPDASLNAIIAEVERAGGEVRSIDKLSLGVLPSTKVENLSYFIIDKSGKPIIALEKGADAATIAHELDHFRMWQSFKEKFIKEGLSEKEAIAKANKVMTSSSPKLIRSAEASAVDAELQHRNFSLFNSDLTKRIVYPERAAITKTYEQATDIKKIPKKYLAQVYQQMDAAIAKALTIRELRISEIQIQIRKPNITPSEYNQLNIKLTEQFNYDTLGKEMGFIDSSKSMKLFKTRFPEVLKRQSSSNSN
ncbi:MAG TPA: hypothetical protein VIG33_04670 [Pseudobdellovibrionaceae bacterium]